MFCLDVVLCTFCKLEKGFTEMTVLVSVTIQPTGMLKYCYFETNISNIMLHT